MVSRRTRKGFEAERELARKLWEAGLAVIRAPASGAGTRRVFYPDLVAMYHGRIAIIEVKYRATPASYIKVDEARARSLEEYAKRAGGEVFVAIKLPSMGWRFIRLEEIGTQTTRIEQIISRGFDIEAFIRYMKGAQITSFIQSGKFSAHRSSDRE